VELAWQVLGYLNAVVVFLIVVVVIPLLSKRGARRAGFLNAVAVFLIVVVVVLLFRNSDPSP
jgi:hypothetical protein